MTPEQHRKEWQRRIEDKKAKGRRYSKELYELAYWTNKALGKDVVRVKAETRKIA
jgi:hypothetical protein